MIDFELQELTQKQYKYCEGVLKGLSKLEAMKRAGYAVSEKNNVVKVDKYPNVQSYIKKRRLEILIKSNITIESQIKDLEEIKRRCMQKKPVKEEIKN
jgi:phage terminase small subunit